MLYHFDSQNILDIKACYIIFIILSLHLQSQNVLDTDESYIIFINLSLHLQSQNVLDINPCISYIHNVGTAFAVPKYFRY